MRMTCKLNPCCGDPYKCEPPKQFEDTSDDSAVDEARSDYDLLNKFHQEVWGWLLKRGLVDRNDDEWDGFVAVIEEHEGEIEAAAIRSVAAKHNKRVTELLEANNRYLQEARDARALLRQAQQEVRQMKERT